MELKAGFVCDRGLNPKRPVNQDRYLAAPEHGLFAVFDGVGGQRAGEVASQAAADTIEEALAHIEAASSVELIRRAIRFANRDIFEMAESDPAYKTMATTIALLYVDGEDATIAHVGDSRVYRLEDGRFHRETIDHTDYYDSVREGLAGGERHADHGRNIINRALGVEADVDVEIKSIHVRDGERFLLCSDGIYRHIPDEEIARVLAQNKDPQRAADELKRLVHERGADDNLTAVVVQVGRARQSAVLSIEDASSSYRGKPQSTAQTAEAPNATRGAQRDGRIQVEVGNPRPSSSAAMDAAPRRPLDDDDEPRSGASGSHKFVWTLVVLVLMAAAFYGGLRASEWWKAGTASPPPRDNVTELLKTGRAAFDTGNNQVAAASFTAAVERDGQNADAHYWLGRAQLEQGEYAKAATSFDNAISRRATLFDAYAQAAVAYEAAGEKTKAAQMLARYVEERRKQPATARSENANSSFR